MSDNMGSSEQLALLRERLVPASDAATPRINTRLDYPPLTPELKDAIRAGFTGLEEYVRKVVDAAPPLSPGQRDRIASILRG